MPVDIKRLTLFVLLLLFIGYAVKYATTSKETNPYVSQAEIVKIPDNIIIGAQTEHGVIVDMFAGTESTINEWKISGTYSSSSSAFTRVETSGTKTYTTVINVIFSNKHTVTYVTAGPDGNKASTVIKDQFVAPYDIIGNYPYVAHIVTKAGKDPAVIVFNSLPTTIVLNNETIVPYVFIKSFTTSIDGVKHVYVTSVSGQYVIQKANYTTEILH